MFRVLAAVWAAGLAAVLTATPVMATAQLDSRGAEPLSVRCESPFLYLTLPDGVSDDSLASPAWRARVLDPALVAGAAEMTGGDAIVVISRRDGRSVLEDSARPSAAPGAAANTLRFTFDSPLAPWSAAEIDQMQHWIADLYPVMVAVYGTPAFDVSVNIRKVPTPSMNWYASGTNEIGLACMSEPTDVLCQPAHVLCHEILHAFRDDAIIASGPYEEGMASAGTAAVMKQLADYWSSNERHAASMSYYELLNRPPIAAWGGSFASNSRFSLRYDMSDYAWTKLVLNSGTFLADFNRAYYAALAAAGDRNWGPDDAPAFKAIARSLVPVVDEMDFDVWHARQHVLNLWPAQGGYALYQTNIGEDAVASMTIVQLFGREGGAEIPIANTTVRLRIFDHAGRPLSDTSAPTAYDGSAWFRVDLPPEYQSYQGRVEVIASAATAAGAIDDTTYRSRHREGGLFGVVTGALAGDVTAIHLASGTTATTVLTNGCFDLPSLEMLAGTFRITFRAPDGRTASQVVTKDSSPYYVALDAGVAPPVTNLVSNPSFDEPTHLRWDGYHGARLRLVSGGRGESGYCLEMRGPESVGQFGINDHPNWVAGARAGERYRFTAWVSGSSSAGTSRLRVREYLHEVRVGDALYSNRVTLAAEWRKLTVEYVVKKNGASLDLQVVADPIGSGATFRVDDIAIEAVGGPTTAPLARAGGAGDGEGESAAPSGLSASLAPTPFSTRAELRFSTSRPGPLTVDLYDLHGRRVRALAREDFAAAGPHRILVTRLDAAGGRIPRGICFYRIVAAEGVVTGRVVIVD